MWNRIASNRFMAYLLWLLVTALGWLVGVIHLSTNARTFLEIARLIPLYLAEGLLIGAAVGIGQAWALRSFIPRMSEWFGATLLSYALALPAGLIIMISIPSIAFPLQGEAFLPLSGPSSMTIYSLFPESIFWGGFLVGIAQWRILKQFIPDPDVKKALLWILTPSLGFGLGIFIWRCLWAGPFGWLGRTALGAVNGMLTGLVLLILFGQNQAAKKQPSHRNCAV